MTIQASNYPTTKPALTLDFAKSKQLDPRIAFTRSSSGTYVDANGLIQSTAADTARFDHNPATGESLGLLVEEARTNSATYSADLVNGGWGSGNSYLIPNALLAPDQTYTALFIKTVASSNYHYINRNIAVSSGATVAISCYLKQGGYQYGYIYSDAAAKGAIFDLSAGTVVGSIVAAPTSSSIKPAGNGWYLCSITVTVPSTATTIWIGPTNSPSTGFFAADGISGMYAWGAQVETGSFPTSYIPTPATFTSRASSATYYDSSGTVQTAASGVARSNAFFPDSNGVMRSAGLLLEAAATNIILNSATGFKYDAANPPTGASYSTGSITDPTGTTSTVNLLTQDSSTGLHRAYVFVNNTYVDWRGSIFIKPNGTTKIRVVASVTISTTDYIDVDLSTGAILGSAGNGGRVDKLANGWVRVGSVGSASKPDRFGVLLLDSSGATSFTGDNASGVYLWGAQVEQAAGTSSSTSYISTGASTVTRSADVSSSATVTRSADVASITGTNFSSWYSSNQGTVFAQMTNGLGGLGAGANSTYIAISNGVPGASLSTGDGIKYASGSPSTYTRSQIRTSGLAVLDYNTSINPKKIAIAYQQDNFGVATDGTLSTFTSGNVPTGMNTFTLLSIGSTPYSRLAYWPTRLSNATLQAITA